MGSVVMLDRFEKLFENIFIYLIERFNVNFMFNLIEVSDKNSYRLYYPTVENLYKKILERNFGQELPYIKIEDFLDTIKSFIEKEKLSKVEVENIKKKFENFWEEFERNFRERCKKQFKEIDYPYPLYRLICEAFGLKEYIYQDSELGFAPEVLRFNTNAVFFDISHIPIRMKLKKQNYNDFLSYILLQSLEELYLFPKDDSKSYIICLCPFSPLWYMRILIFFWESYDINNIFMFTNIKYHFEGIQFFLKDFIEKISSLFLLYHSFPLIKNHELIYMDSEAVFNMLYPEIIRVDSLVGDEVIKTLKTYINMILHHRKKEYNYSIESGISAIISRNMSHNIGSHVIIRAKVQNVKQKIENFINRNGIEEGDVIINLVDLLKSNLDEYIQHKGDFLAEIATEPLMNTKTVRFYQDIVLRFVSNTLLIDNLGANEDIIYKSVDKPPVIFHVKLNGKEVKVVFKCDCREYVYPDTFPYIKFCLECGKEIVLDKIVDSYNKKVEDLLVEVPGCLGEFAFFGIFENLIRNIAKYNKPEKIEIHLEIFESKNKGEYEIKLWDEDTDADKLVKKTVTMENGKLKKFHSTLYDLLSTYNSTPIIDTSGKLIPQAWGIAEIKICTTLLAGSTDFTKMNEYLTIEKESNPIKGNGKPKNIIVYKFRVKKPVYLIVVKENNFKSLEKRSRNDKVILLDEVNFTNNYSALSLSPQLLVVEKGIDVGIDKSLYPFRFVEIESNKLEELIANPVLGYKYWIKNKWLKKEEKEKKIIIINLQTINDVNKWKALLKEFNAQFNDNVLVAILYNEGTAYKIIPESLQQKSLSQYSLYLWDRHGEGINVLSPEVDQVKFLCVFDKLSLDFSWLFTSEPTEELLYNLVEASFIKILIIDERFVERIMDYDDELGKVESYLAPYRWSALAKAGVYVVTHINDEMIKKIEIEKTSTNLGLNLHIEKKGNLKLEQLQEKKELKDDIDIAIIHQGLLDNIEDKLGMSPKDFLQLFRNNGIETIIESGRGIPPAVLSEELSKERFMPYSFLSSHLLEKRIAKFSLTKHILKLNRRIGDADYGSYNQNIC